MACTIELTLINQTQKYHIALVFYNESVWLYENGNLLSKSTTNNEFKTCSDWAIQEIKPQWKGAVTDIRYWNKPLQPEELGKAINGNESGLVSWYPMSTETPNDNIIIDVIGGYHLSFTNAEINIYYESMLLFSAKIINDFSALPIPVENVLKRQSQLVGSLIAEKCALFHARCEKMVSACYLKSYFNLAEEVPDSFLNQHITNACLQLYRDTSIPERSYPKEHVDEWQQAQLYLAYANALPWLNTFTMQGAAKAERLAAQLDTRFMDSNEVKAIQKAMVSHYNKVIRTITKQSFFSFQAI